MPLLLLQHLDGVARFSGVRAVRIGVQIGLVRFDRPRRTEALPTLFLQLAGILGGGVRGGLAARIGFGPGLSGGAFLGFLLRPGSGGGAIGFSLLLLA